MTLRHDILATGLDLKRWARTKGLETSATAERLAEQLYAHGSAEPPKTKLGLLRVIEELRAKR